jgi:hypothetical protein
LVLVALVAQMAVGLTVQIRFFLLLLLLAVVELVVAMLLRK